MVAYERTMTTAEIFELEALKTELFGDSMFVVMDETDPKVRRYSELMELWQEAMGRLNGHHV